MHEYAADIKPDRIITFDSKGVSFHPNHIAVSKGVRSMSKEYEVKELVTGPWIMKYLGVFSLAFEEIKRIIKREKSSLMFITPLKKILCLSSFKAFMCHKSQIVWYRILNLMFSKFHLFNVIH